MGPAGPPWGLCCEGPSVAATERTLLPISLTSMDRISGFPGYRGQRDKGSALRDLGRQRSLAGVTVAEGASSMPPGPLGHSTGSQTDASARYVTGMRLLSHGVRIRGDRNSHSGQIYLKKHVPLDNCTHVSYKS